MGDKQIEDLIPNIEKLLVEGVQDIPDDVLKSFTKNIAISIKDSLSQRERKSTLRMSNVGKPCARQLWYEINTPEDGEGFRPEAYMKFMYGHLVESLLLFLAELAGHKVEGRQDEQEIEGIKGHRDAVIDGMVVDVKSASQYSFKKFKEGRLHEDDAFGYIPQLQSYLHAGQEDEKVTEKDRAAFLVMDKTLGHLCLDIHERDTRTDVASFYNNRKEVVHSSEVPERGFEPVAEGYKNKEGIFKPNGNLRLGVNCSYCAYKHKCWGKIRTFLYANNRPVEFVKVVKEPNVPELKKEIN